MKIGYLCESPADRAALEVFSEGILGAPPERINMDLLAHGVTGVLKALDGIYRGVHYNSDADALVVVVDTDRTPMHELAHDKAGGDKSCRYCQIREIIDRARKQLKPRTGRPELKVAVGLAVPAIEAWYLVGNNHDVGEANWKSPSLLDRKQLKKLVYGTDRPSLEHETDFATKESKRIIANLKIIEDAFPIGFGLMAQEIRSWKIKPG